MNNRILLLLQVMSRFFMIALGAVGLAGLPLLGLGSVALGQGRVAAISDSTVLSLDDALSRALGQSQEVRLARAQMDLADVQVTATRAQALPPTEWDAELHPHVLLAVQYRRSADPRLAQVLSRLARLGQ
jgi:hypothetical protein